MVTRTASNNRGAPTGAPTAAHAAAMPREAAAPPEPERAAAATGTAVATIDLGADAGAGLEGADKDTFAIPFLAVLQANSPQVDTVAGARGGMFFNTVTQELYEKPRIVPCAFQRRYVRWGAREMGGGFKGEFTPAQANEMKARGEVKELDNRLYFPLPDGSINEKKCDRLSDTRNHYVLLCSGPDSEIGAPAVFALASTGIGVSKNLMSRIEAKKIKVNDKLVPAPSFACVYEVTVEKKENEKGKWWKPIITPLSDVTSPSLYAQARAFHKQVVEGRVKVAQETRTEEGSAGGGDGGGSGDDTPF